MPEAVPKSWRGVVNRYNSSPEEIRGYFSDIPALIENYDWEVSLGFMFARVEKAHNILLYRGAVKIHRANPTVAPQAVDRHHMTRKEFRRLYKNVFGEPLPQEAVDLIKDAEAVRDKVLHGKSASDALKRKAIVRILEYAEKVNSEVQSLAQFKPFINDSRGYTGRREALDESTTQW